jgi:nicotinate dehydrogenase subunit B
MAAPGGHAGTAPTGGAPSGADAFFGKRSDQVDDWLAFGLDGTVTAFSGKVELGTGVRTALGQIVAEELDLPPERVRVVMGDTALTPDEGYTAGSMTLHMSGTALRQAAAEARQALLELAGERLDAEINELAVQDGTIRVRADPARQVSYAELAGGRRLERTVSGTAPLKNPQDYQTVGASTPRVDLPGKFTGQPSFVSDLRLPGMLHGRVLSPPSMGAQLTRLDPSAAEALPGVVQVVHIGNFVGVVAEREEQALAAVQALHAEWHETTTQPRQADLPAALKAGTTQEAVVLKEAGQVDEALRQAPRRLTATYVQPYHAHATIGPSCAVADVAPDAIRVWCSTQGPNPLRGALAQLLQVPVEKIRLTHLEGAGSYGHNGADDAAADAVILSRAVGRPVRVQWSRAHEFVWEPKAAAMVSELQAGLDEGGNVVGWQYDVWSPTHTSRPRFAGQLISAQWMASQGPPETRFFLGGERNAPTNYTFANQRVRVHWVSRSPLRVSSFRTLGATGNCFANECFMDELAAAAGADPLEFRLRYLDDPRGIAVLKAAAERAGWQPGPAQQTGGPGQGRGIAYSQYENTEAYLAAVAEVSVDTTSGVVRVERIIVAQDCGLIVNPDGVRNQVEGNVLQSLSRCLKEEVCFDETRITSVDWQTYPILTFSEVPEVEVVLVNRTDQPSLGVGEPASILTAPAVANAIFNATGARLRQAPFTPARVLAALQNTRH